MIYEKQKIEIINTLLTFTQTEHQLLRIIEILNE